MLQRKLLFDFNFNHPNKYKSFQTKVDMNSRFKLPYFIVLIFVFTSSCKSQTSTFQPMADGIKQYFLENVPNIKSVDTVYVLIDTITPRLKCIVQSAEYYWASTEAKTINSADSSILKAKGDSVIDLSDKLDNTTFLYYRARPLIIYTKSNLEKGMAEKWLYFDKSFKLTPKYSFINKIAKTDNESLSLETYTPLSQQDYKNFEESGVLIYY